MDNRKWKMNNYNWMIENVSKVPIWFKIVFNCQHILKWFEIA